MAKSRAPSSWASASTSLVSLPPFNWRSEANPLNCAEAWITDKTDGRVITNGTWFVYCSLLPHCRRVRIATCRDYKPPSSKDIPVVFNVTLLKELPNPEVGNILSSKVLLSFLLADLL